MAAASSDAYAAPVVVREGLLLGRNSCCISEAGVADLRGRGVTHVVAVSMESSLVELGKGIAFMRVPIVDDIGEPLHTYLEDAATLLHAALAGGSCACVCCAGGTSAGPAVAMYYLMRYDSKTLAEALDAVCAAQPDAQPNIGFIQRLIEAEAWLHGNATPSLTIQQYKWHFLQRLFPEVERERVFEALHAGRHVITKQLRTS